MSSPDTSFLDDAELARAAAPVAAALGLAPDGGATAWPDAVATHLIATFDGPRPGVLHLGVDGEAARALVADPSRTVELLGPVLGALGIPTDDVDVEPLAPAGPAARVPTRCLTSPDGGTAFALELGEPAGAARPFEPTPLPAAGPQGHGAGSALDVLEDIDMSVTVELGRTRLAIRDLRALAAGMVVEIDRAAGAPVDVLVNGSPVASGEIVVIDDEFAVRITEIAGASGRP